MCSDEEMEKLLEALRSGPVDELAAIGALLNSHPDDARLHFLRGSILAGSNRPIEAHAALERAVTLAPDFAIARFQLGFFELTSGEPERALATWRSLEALPDEHHLRHFVTGLSYMIQDQFAAAVTALKAGIAVNSENPPLNGDMQLLIDRMSEHLAQSGPEARSEETSATSFLLDQLGARGTMH